MPEGKLRHRMPECPRAAPRQCWMQPWAGLGWLLVQLGVVREEGTHLTAVVLKEAEERVEMYG